MTRYQLLVVAVLLAVLPAAAHAQGKPRKPPNILYIMSDDHASAAIGCYGSWLGKYAKTPRLDRLAKQGMRITNGCVTNSICTPSQWELFDRQKDPQQLRSVYNDRAYAETVRELRAELDRLRRKYGDEH